MARLTLVIMAAAALCGCSREPVKPAPSKLTAAEVIRALGSRGRACFEREGKTFCTSKDTQPLKAITQGDKLLPTDTLVLCVEAEGALGQCQPVAEGWHCAENVGCRCTGIDACLTMVDKCGDLPGSCGDCTGAHCCCGE